MCGVHSVCVNLFRYYFEDDSSDLLWQRFGCNLSTPVWCVHDYRHLERLVKQDLQLDLLSYLANKWQDSPDLFVSQSCGLNPTGRHTSTQLNLNPTIYPFHQLWKVFFICPDINRAVYFGFLGLRFHQWPGTGVCEQQVLRSQSSGGGEVTLTSPSNNTTAPQICTLITTELNYINRKEASLTLLAVLRQPFSREDFRHCRGSISPPA